MHGASGFTYVSISITWKPKVPSVFLLYILASPWDSAHLTQLQSNWDKDNLEDETAEDKIARLGARPTSYSS